MVEKTSPPEDSPRPQLRHLDPVSAGLAWQSRPRAMQVRRCPRVGQRHGSPSTPHRRKAFGTSRARGNSHPDREESGAAPIRDTTKRLAHFYLVAEVWTNSKERLALSANKKLPFLPPKSPRKTVRLLTTKSICNSYRPGMTWHLYRTRNTQAPNPQRDRLTRRSLTSRSQLRTTAKQIKRQGSQVETGPLKAA